MSESRPTLTSSISFAGSSSANALAKPLKRRLTTTPDLNFFTPAAQSFKPRPYTPNAASANAKPQPATTRNSSSMSSMVPTIPAMDPSLSDPGTIFIHPPFNNFPDAHLHPEGLSFTLMAQNPEWFLDAVDFVSTTPESDSQETIAYPPQLEPPRGWCPAKKKDLKALGAEGWPEGEEPRLRCTFCRRTYAGVNAKSMWRRHVYEKHKIAMANRREGADRSRVGRGSNKENKHAHFAKDHRSDGARKGHKLISMDHDDEGETFVLSLSSSFQTQTFSSQGVEDYNTPSAPYIIQQEFAQPTMSVDFSQSQESKPSVSPPLTPKSVSPQLAQTSLSEPAFPSPERSESVIPPSPAYNPLLTPSFRHSPARLPSDQPWRYPSPSHPLHSRARELYLGAVVCGAASPSIKGTASFNASPASLLNTPAIIHMARGSAPDSEDTDHLDSSPIGVRSSPRSLFNFGMSPYAPSSAPLDFKTPSRVDDSPLGRFMRHKKHHRQKSSLSTYSELGNLFSEASSSGLGGDNGLMTSIRLESEDPFGLYPSWFKESKSTGMGSPGGESPVLRSSQSFDESMEAHKSNTMGLGIGLGEPFALPDESYPSADADMEVKGDIHFDFNYPPSPEEREEAEVEGVLGAGPPGLPKFPMRRAQTSMAKPTARNSERQDELELSPPPVKRRRTVDTCG